MKNYLLTDWKKQIPAEAPNYFVINIEPSQVNELKQMLDDNRVSSTRFYPIVRGRLTAINDESVKQRFGEQAKSINALQRELNLSWTDSLPDANVVVEGRWHPDNLDIPWVSVDKGLAEQLGLRLGDTVSFQIGGMALNAQVTSFRDIDWSSFKPNFFMLFKPGLLVEFPQTSITSLYLPPENKSFLIQLTKAFPNISVIDLANMLRKVQSIMDGAAKTITLLTFFALSAGLVIISLSILSLNTLKRQETKILKILGMRRNNLLWIRTSEAVLLGLFTGLLAAVSAVLINVYLAKFVLEIQFSIPWMVFIIIPLMTVLVTVVINGILQRYQYQTE